jgi:hypothetical protein
MEFIGINEVVFLCHDSFPLKSSSMRSGTVPPRLRPGRQRAGLASWSTGILLREECPQGRGKFPLTRERRPHPGSEVDNGVACDDSIPILLICLWFSRSYFLSFNLARRIVTGRPRPRFGAWGGQSCPSRA